MAAEGRAERGSRGRRRRAGPGRANGARAGGSLNPLSRARGPARPGSLSLRAACPARSHGRDQKLLRQATGAGPHGGEGGEADGAGHAPGGRG